MNTLKGKLQCVALSDTGKVREHNEDTIAIDADIGLLVLADGMGGYNAGEVASGIAVKTIVNLVREAVIREDLEGQDAESGLARPSIILRDAIYRANKIIHQTSKTQPQCEGMGTTVVCCLFYDNKVSIAHVGDSRLYRLRGESFEQITRDHSLLQEQIDSGMITKEAAKLSQNKNLVTRALGIDAEVDTEVHVYDAKRGDIYLLCSDGLSDMVEDEDIHLTLSSLKENLQLAADQLVQQANDNGGRDNVSVILVRVKDEYAAPKGWLTRLVSWFK
jgi:protein phosphatase